MDIYISIAPMRFYKTASKQSVLHYTIVSDVNATTEKVAKKGKPELTINKQQHNKIAKLMSNVGKISILLNLLISCGN